MYRVEWRISGEHQIPKGPGAQGFGGLLSYEEAKSIVDYYHPPATLNDPQATHPQILLRPDDFQKYTGLTHRVIKQEALPGISLQGMKEIITLLGGSEALHGKNTVEVFRMYSEATKLQDPVTPLTLAVRSMLNI